MIRVFRHHISAGVFPLLVSEVLLISASFAAGAAIWLNMQPWFYFLRAGGLQRASVSGLTILIALYFHHLYSDIRVTSRIRLLQQLLQVIGIALLTESVLGYLNHAWMVDRQAMLYGNAIALVVLFVWRLTYSTLLLHNIGRQKILFVGQNETVQAIAAEVVDNPGRPFEIAGYLEDRFEPGTQLTGGTVLGPVSAMRQVVSQIKPDRIVVGLMERRGAMPVADLLELRFAGMMVEEAATTYESVYRRVCSGDLHPTKAVLFRGLNPPTGYLTRQGVWNRILAAVLLVALSPLMLLIALVLMLTSRESLIARYPRVGMNGRVFQMFRFRGAGSTGLYRRLHLDALPELFNVLRGEMALVGPRPEPPATVKEVTSRLPLYEYRHNVPPGITGWAQINLVGHETEADAPLRLEYDLYYVKHMSQSLNAYILLNTLKNRLVWADQVWAEEV